MREERRLIALELELMSVEDRSAEAIREEERRILRQMRAMKVKIKDKLVNNKTELCCELN